MGIPLPLPKKGADPPNFRGQGQPIGAFELPTISEAVHAGCDDRSPIGGLSGFIIIQFNPFNTINHFCLDWVGLEAGYVTSNIKRFNFYTAVVM